MTELQIQAAGGDDLNDIQFINKAEIKEYIYLFKSLDSANYAMNEVKNEHQENEKSIAIINDVAKKASIEAVNSLLKAYKWVVFINNDNNFTDNEILKIGLAVENVIYINKKNTCNGWADRSIFYRLSDGIGNPKERLMGKQYSISLCSLGELDEKIFLYKNTFIKISKDPKNIRNIRYKVLTNYSFNIKEIKINADEDAQMQDLTLEIADFSGNTKSIQIPAKDKYSIASFRKILYPVGAFLDCMSSNDFNQIMHHLYLTKEYKIVYMYNRPGLVLDKNVWLLADEVINLEE